MDLILEYPVEVKQANDGRVRITFKIEAAGGRARDRHRAMKVTLFLENAQKEFRLGRLLQKQPFCG